MERINLERKRIGLDNHDMKSSYKVINQPIWKSVQNSVTLLEAFGSFPGSL